MKTSIGLLVPALLMLVALSSQAATITNTYYITATGFQARLKVCDPPVAAPVDPVNVAFSISFDNGALISDSAANVTLISLNMPNNGSLLYSYQPTADDSLSVGDGLGSNTVMPGSDDFHVTLFHISSTSPTFAGLTYTVSSPANAAKCVFDAAAGTVSVGPPWTHVQFPMTGIRLVKRFD